MRNRFGWSAGIIVAAALAIAAAFLPGEWLELRSDASLLRIVTCHFTHWSHEQLAWDALAFTALGLACARRNARATYATLLASVFVIPVAVLAFAPEVVAYRGLSGLASAMFALLLVLERRRLTWPVVTFTILFAAKLAFEAITGGAVFANDMGNNVAAVPVVHLAGALLGVIGGLQQQKKLLLLAPLALASCITVPIWQSPPQRASQMGSDLRNGRQKSEGLAPIQAPHGSP
jgi:membrane associated rhomboid family serine protease